MGSDEATAANATDALAERLFEATIGTLELFAVHLGWRLGLYRVLVGAGAITADDLAARGGIDARYAREWLEQQAVAGFLHATDDEPRRFELPVEHVPVLADAGHLAHVAPFAPMVVGIAGTLPAVVAAYRTGEGVPYVAYGPDFRDGQGAINRPAFEHDIATWIAAAPDVHSQLSAGHPVAIADVGCGQGFSTVALARAYPDATVTGFDLDEASVLDAKRYSADTEVADRVSFTAGDIAANAPANGFALVCMFEALHDMADPVGVLRAVRAATAPDGAVLVVDERVAEEFTAPGDPVERMMYGWSVSHCLPASRAETPSAALGTALRPATVERLGREAGFAGVEVLDVANDFFRFYLLRG